MAKRKKPKTMGYRIYKARKSMKMTQQELADKVNMKVSYIRDLEDDKITVGADMLYKIAVALGTTIAELSGLPVRMRANS